MNTEEFIMKDLATGKAGRYQFTYHNRSEMLKAIDLNMLLTVDEIVEVIMDGLEDQDKKDMGELNKNEFIRFHNEVGEDLRIGFGLYLDGNPNVLVNPTDTSIEILQIICNMLAPTQTTMSQVMRFT